MIERFRRSIRTIGRACADFLSFDQGRVEQALDKFRQWSGWFALLSLGFLAVAILRGRLFEVVICGLVATLNGHVWWTYRRSRHKSEG